MTVSINVSPEKASKKGNTLHIKGELTVANASFIKDEMIKALNKYSLISLSVDEVERLDLSVLQLIYAFQRAARSSGKEVSVNVSLPDDILVLVRQSGLEKVFNQTV